MGQYETAKTFSLRIEPNFLVNNEKLISEKVAPRELSGRVCKRKAWGEISPVMWY